MEPEVSNRSDVRTLEMSLQRLWEKARRVSEIVSDLKEENKTLQDRVAGLERAEQKLKNQLEEGERELERIRAELGRMQSNGNELFSKDEKEALKARIKELIAKINSRL